MSNSNGFTARLTPGNKIQIVLILAMGVMAWTTLQNSVAQIVERESEHYELLRTEILGIEEKLEEHLDNYTDHLLTEHRGR